MGKEDSERVYRIQGYLAHKKQTTLPGPPKDPRHRPTVGSWGGALSYERGTPVLEIKDTPRLRVLRHRGTSLIRNSLPP
jgi:hypothetical protein